MAATPQNPPGNILFDLHKALFDAGLIRTLSHRQLKTLLAFLKFADNRTGIAWPAVATVAQLIGSSRRHVHETIRQLEQMGLLITLQTGTGRGSPSRRRLVVPEGDRVAGRKAAQPEHESLPDSADMGARFSPERVPDSGTRTYPGTSPGTYPLTCAGTSTENRSGLEEIPDSLDVPEFKTAWTEFLSHRQHLHRPVTPEAARRQLGRLAALGPARAVAAIHYSIENGWQGIFEPRGETHEQRNRQGRADKAGGEFAEDLRL